MYDQPVCVFVRFWFLVLSDDQLLRAQVCTTEVRPLQNPLLEHETALK